MKNSFIILFLLCGLLAQAQTERFRKGGSPKEEQQEEPEEEKTTEEEPTFFDRLVIGGSLGLSFGSYTQIMIAPQVGYRFSDKFVAGPGFIYNYLQVNQLYNYNTGRYEKADIENTVYGPSLFGFYFPFENMFTGLQVEMINHDYTFRDRVQGQLTVENRWTPVLWVQAGYSQPVGNKGFVQLGLRLNVLHDETSPYNSWAPIISLYF